MGNPTLPILLVRMSQIGLGTRFHRYLEQKAAGTASASRESNSYLLVHRRLSQAESAALSSPVQSCHVQELTTVVLTMSVLAAVAVHSHSGCSFGSSFSSGFSGPFDS